MKNYYFLFLLTAFGASAQNVTFTDPNLKVALTSIDTTPYALYFAKDLLGLPLTIDANGDGEIQVSEAQAVSQLTISNDETGNYPIPDYVFTSLGGIENFTNLNTLACSNHHLTSLDVTAITGLQNLQCHNNFLTSLNVSGLANLHNLDCAINNLTQLNLSGLGNLNFFFASQNSITSLSLTGLTNLLHMDVSFNPLTGLNPAGLVNLSTLNVDNCTLTALPLTGLSGLTNLSCRFNAFTSLDLTGLLILNTLDFEMCMVDTINLDQAPALSYVKGTGNQLSTLDLSYPNNLVTIVFESGLSDIDLSGCGQLENLILNYNSLQSIDASASPNLSYLSAINNAGLHYVNIKNGSAIDELYLLQNTSLQYICVDESELAFVQNAIDQSQLTCEINTYCSFTPGGATNAVAGTVLFDENANGCDAADGTVPNLAMNVTGNGGTGTVIPNNTGSYTIYVTGGVSTFTPVNPNPAYYTISPANATVDFDTVASPYSLNFCLGATGIFNDLEIALLPLTAARPGFDATYRLSYKNVGTTTLSGNVTLAYMDNVLDYLSATVTPTGATSNVLTFAYTDLHPFGEGFIDVTFNVNSPLETPQVNIGDELDFTATIGFTGTGTDETPLNNTYSINQVVVGSYDPNDKTCVEGTTITPEMVGEYVTYMIRFENTGTYMAENIVVKDVLDATKFDVSTLTPLQSSHEYITRITGHTAEFVFDNIMLPGAPSDERYGFVAFKIKTLPTLSLNDSFSNTAEIYFDYNAPIVTNEAETTVALPLSTTDFDFKSAITLYPNPAGSTLHVDAKDGLNVNSIAVYNVVGQQLISIANAGNNATVDVAALAAGSYIIKVTTDKGTSSGKFIKK